LSECVSAKQHHSIRPGFQSARQILNESNFGFSISRQTRKRTEIIELVRTRRENANQNLGFASRPFVLCGLPVKKPPKGALLHERRNGQFLLQVTGHPQYGVPWGQDRLVPIFLATLAIRQRSQRITFRSAAEMLDLFEMQQGGSQYRRLISAFQRVFGATIFFGTDTQREKAMVMHHGRFNFMREARIWYSRDPEQETCPEPLRTRSFSVMSSTERLWTIPFRRIWKLRKRSRVHRPHWICLCGSPIAASPPKGGSGFLSSVISVSQISWAAPNTLAPVDSENGSTSGWTWSECYGLPARPGSVRMATMS
jgi:hypothetical protein